jgi:VWFA-related protein
MITSLCGMRLPIALLACALCYAQLGYAQDPTTPEMPRRSDIVVPVNVVIAPTTVVDKSGNYINGLTIQEFTLFDNNKPQKITADVAFEPMSLVVAVQASSMLGEILPKIQKIGVLLDNLVVGQDGEAAVVAFDHRIRVMQDFSGDAGKIDAAVKKITPGSSSSRLIDAVTESVRMLKSRPEQRRRVLLLISEKRDKASEGRVRDALMAAQLANVSVYSIDISHLLAEFTSKSEPARQNPIPPTAVAMPPGAAVTPTTTNIQQNSGNVIPLMVEIFKGAKSIFIDDALDVFTRYTGGKQYPFVSQKSLEKAVSAVGEELHSQYLLSYTPNNLAEGGFHEIRVTVNRPNLEIRTRPGYWVAAQP